MVELNGVFKIRVRQSEKRHYCIQHFSVSVVFSSAVSFFKATIAGTQKWAWTFIFWLISLNSVKNIFSWQLIWKFGNELQSKTPSNHEKEPMNTERINTWPFWQQTNHVSTPLHTIVRFDASRGSCMFSRVLICVLLCHVLVGVVPLS